MGRCTVPRWVAISAIVVASKPGCRPCHSASNVSPTTWIETASQIHARGDFISTFPGRGCSRGPVAWPLGPLRLALRGRRPRRDPQLIVDVLDPRDLLGQVLGQALVVPVPYGAEERDFSAGHPDLDVAGVELVVLAHALADVFADTLVRTLVAAWPSPSVRPPAMPLRLGPAPPAGRPTVVVASQVAGSSAVSATVAPAPRPVGLAAALQIAPLAGPVAIDVRGPAPSAHLALVAHAQASVILVSEPRAQLLDEPIQQTALVAAAGILGLAVAVLAEAVVALAAIATTTIPLALAVPEALSHDVSSLQRPSLASGRTRSNGHAARWVTPNDFGRRTRSGGRAQTDRVCAPRCWCAGRRGWR